MEKDWSIISRVAREKKLTKKIFMELEEGCYVEAGNFLVQDENGHFQEKPRFGEYVLPMAERERQWKKIVLQSANNLLCRIYQKRSL